MEQGFWKNMKRPVILLAPMADVTDAAFRRIIAKYGKPDVLWTEFVSADGLCHPLAREKLRIDLSYTEAERPIVAQLFTAHPDRMYEAAQFTAKLGFDGLDINMGCPDRSVEKQGAGAALMKTPEVAREVIRAAKAGAGNIPVSVKTRLGYGKDELESWLPVLLAEMPAAVTIHARTRHEMSSVPARWSRVKDAVALRDRVGSKTLIFGNGDVANISDARQKAADTGADGIMLGRAIFGNPWLFSGRSVASLPLAERLAVMVEHTMLFESLFSGIKNFSVMKKHYKAYVEGFAGARELRAALMETYDAAEVQNIVNRFLSPTQEERQPFRE